MDYKKKSKPNKETMSTSDVLLYSLCIGFAIRGVLSSVLGAKYAFSVFGHSFDGVYEAVIVYMLICAGINIVMIFVVGIKKDYQKINWVDMFPDKPLYIDERD